MVCLIWEGGLVWRARARLQFIASIILALAAFSFFSCSFDFFLFTGLFQVSRHLSARETIPWRRQSSGMNRTGRLFGICFWSFSYLISRDSDLAIGAGRLYGL